MPMTTMKKTIWRSCAASLLMVALTGSGTAAQEPAAACRAFPSLGITGLSCQNCTVSRGGERPFARFSTEPRVLAVDPTGPAAGLLRPSDVIVAVDGHLITTADGGRAFAEFGVGETVRLRIRRDGREREVGITTEALCAPDAPAPRAPPEPRSPREATPAPAPAVPPSPTLGPPRAAAPAPPAAPEPPSEVADRMWRFSRGLPALGMSLSCGDCTLRTDDEGPARWSFSSPPVVTGVDEGSVAGRAGLRARDRLVRIDGVELTTPEGGELLGRLRPGQTVVWTVQRDGRPQEVRMRLPALPEAPPAPEAVRPPARAGALPVAPNPSPAPVGPLRVVTSIGDVDIEVRGEPVVVLEDGDLIVIRSGSFEVRVRRREAPPGPGGGREG